MIQLPNGCSRSELEVNPKNWQKANADLSKTWYVYYRFYDPLYREEKKFKYGKLVIIKGGLNRLKSVTERKIAIKALIENEIQLLEVEGWNPITGVKNNLKQKDIKMLDLSSALELAVNKIDCGNHHRQDLHSVLGYVKKTLSNMPAPPCVANVTKSFIRELLDKCGEMKKNWSPNTYNYYRKNLGSMFKLLIELDAIETNPVLAISKKKNITTIRQTLTYVEREMVANHLKNNHPDFFRFINIFFHSGCRITELLELKGKDVNLESQIFKVVVKKGRSYREVQKVIKDVAFPFWEQLMVNAKKEDFIFSKYLEAGKTSIRPEQITRRWKRHVKDKLGIEADFYSLKHLNTDETAALLDLGDAAAHNSHTSTVITLKHYAFGEKARQQERIKKVGNSFAG
jgi:site-specific recombinase XerD